MGCRRNASLAEQAQRLEELKAEDEKAARRARKGAPEATGSAQGDLDVGHLSLRGERHGPGYQINVNDIEGDPEKATRMIRERETDRVKGTGTGTPKRDVKNGGGAETPDGGKSSEALHSFFAEFRLPHPQLRLKQHQLRLVTVSGTGETISCRTIRVTFDTAK